MPFTGSHPMAVLPLLWRRLHLDATCLVIGSMSPDFEYFVHGELTGTFAHTLRGLALFCVPMTLATAAVYHVLVKPVAVAVAPAWLRREAALAPWQERWGAWVIASVVISAAIGAFSHLVWDSFTHANGWGVAHFPVLHRLYDVPVIGTLALHRVLQHVCSVIGLAVVGGFAIRGLRHSPKIEAAAPTWWRVVFVACVVIAIAALIARLLAHHLTDPGNLIVGVISGTFAGSIVASAAIRLFR
jgi:Domain of unknown function (DUF4184)